MSSSKDNGNGEGGSGWLRRLVLTALVLSLVAAGRRWALARSDREFEQRLMAADRRD